MKKRLLTWTVVALLAGAAAAQPRETPNNMPQTPPDWGYLQPGQPTNGLTPNGVWPDYRGYNGYQAYDVYLPQGYYNQNGPSYDSNGWGRNQGWGRNNGSPNNGGRRSGWNRGRR